MCSVLISPLGSLAERLLITSIYYKLCALACCALSLFANKRKLLDNYVDIEVDVSVICSGKIFGCESSSLNCWCGVQLSKVDRVVMIFIYYSLQSQGIYLN